METDTPLAVGDEQVPISNNSLRTPDLRFLIRQIKTMMSNNSSQLGAMYPLHNATDLANYGGMGNFTTEGVIRDAEEGCFFFTFICYVVVFGCMCIFGLIGNTLSFFVLQWEKQNHVATFLLQAMAVTDNLFLITTGFSQIFSAIALYITLEETPLWAIMKVGVWPVVYITQLATVWMTVLIAFNRFIAICRPFQAHKLCTMKRTRIQIAIMFTLIILYNLPRFFENRIVYEYYTGSNETYPTGIENDLKRNKYYNYIYEIIMYCLVYFLGPIIVLIVLNTCLIRELWNARKRLLARQLPANMMGGEEAENSLTLVMIVIILIFLCCQLPAFLNQLIYIMNESAYECGKPYFYYYHLSNLIASANSSVNFIVYCIFRKQFRERLKAFCRRDHLMKRTDIYNYDNGKTASVYSKNSNVVHL